MRWIGSAVLCLALAPLGCGGGGGSSPSEPRTPPPAALAGTWSGSVAFSNPGRAACTVTLALVQDGLDFVGNWEGRCPDAQGSGIVVATPLFGNLVFVAGLQGRPVFGGCGWSSVATREGDRLRGEFNTPQNCAGGPALQGQLDLSKR